MRDLHNNIVVTQLTNPANATSTVTSTAVDLLGANSAEVLFSIGLSADTLSGSVYWTLSLTECDTSGGSYTAVAASDIIGSTGVVIDSSSEDEKAYKIGYKGSKRYLKGVVTATGSHSSGTPIAIIAITSHLADRPAV